MRYFIGHLIQGEAARWHNSLTKEIADKFGTPRLDEKFPPHLTIFAPFETNDIEAVRVFMKNWIGKREAPGDYRMSDFGRFDDRVVFTGIVTDGSVTTSVAQLHKEGSTRFPFLTAHLPWHPHATLAYKLPPDAIRNIWEYVNTLPRPDFLLPFDNATIFRFEDQKWVVDECFLFFGETRQRT